MFPEIPGLSNKFNPFLKEIRTMKNILLFAAATLLFGCSLSITNSGVDSCRFFPALGDAPLSNQFKVEVNGNEIAVEKIEKFDIPVHYAHFACDGSAKLKIRISAAQKITSFVISPVSKQIKGKVKNSKLLFTLERPGYFAVKINEMDWLFIIADSLSDYRRDVKNMQFVTITDYGVDNTGKTLETVKIQKAIDEVSVSGGVLFFPNGIYKTGQINFKSNMCVLLDDGALIKGSSNPADYPGKTLIGMDSVKNFKLLGYGTIDGAGWEGLRRNGAKEYHLIFATNCENILMDGVLLRDPVFWNTRVFRSKHFHMKNIKVLNNRPYKNWTNTDGIDFDSSTDCSLIHSVMHCGDDNLVVKGLDSEKKFKAERILFQDVLVLSNSAAAKIGTETCIKEFNNIVFRNIDVIKCKRGLVINGFDSAMIKNVVFENINIENFDFNGNEGPRIIDFEITNESWRKCPGLCRIDSVRLNNINVYCQLDGVTSQIHGRTREFNINNVMIRNFKINGDLVTSLKDSRININEFAQVVVTKSIYLKSNKQ
jgi:polygalacturonase